LKEKRARASVLIRPDIAKLRRCCFWG
jgi:hypothetical protein